MTIELHPDLEARITQLVESGRFSTPEDAIRAGIESLPAEQGSKEDDFPEGAMNLAELFAQSPFKGIDLDLSRDQSTLRDIDW
jgi:Arc/MetJ-type ribon-helix-helix transcriptional regulator